MIIRRINIMRLTSHIPAEESTLQRQSLERCWVKKTEEGMQQDGILVGDLPK
jgi:SOS-response transcriptional repressor LexA